MVAGLAAGFIRAGLVVRGTNAPAVSPGPRGGTWTTCRGQTCQCTFIIMFRISPKIYSKSPKR